MAGSSCCIVATSGWASSEAFLVSRSQPFAFFLLFLFLMSSFSLGSGCGLLTFSCMTCAVFFRGRGVRGRGMARFLYFFLRDFCRVLAAGQVRGLDFSRLLASS